MSSGTVAYGADGARRSFGPSDVETKYPSKVRAASEEKQLVVPLVYNDLNVASANTIKDVLNQVIPAKSIITRVVVNKASIAFAGGTSYDVGTYLASDGTTVVDADGILAAITPTELNAGKAFYPDSTMGTISGAQIGFSVGAADVVVAVAATGTFTAGATEIKIFYVSP